MSFDFSPIAESWRFLASGLLVTLLLSGVSLLIAVVVGSVVGLLRTYGGRAIDIVLSFYVDTVRAIPVLVILVWTYFALPLLTGYSFSPFTAASIALGVYQVGWPEYIFRRLDIYCLQSFSTGRGKSSWISSSKSKLSSTNSIL
jgi:polar amino acid transport system permease protein